MRRRLDGCVNACRKRDAVWVLTHPDLRRSARIRAFMQAIGAMLATHEQSLLGLRET